jgi:hypothetical protein
MALGLSRPMTCLVAWATNFQFSADATTIALAGKCDNLKLADKLMAKYRDGSTSWKCAPI